MYEFNKKAVLERAIQISRKNQMMKQAALNKAAQEQGLWDKIKATGGEWLDKAKQFGNEHKWVEPVAYGAAGAGLPWLISAMFGMKPKAATILSIIGGLGGAGVGAYRNGLLDQIFSKTPATQSSRVTNANMTDKEAYPYEYFPARDADQEALNARQEVANAGGTGQAMERAQMAARQKVYNKARKK